MNDPLLIYKCGHSKVPVTGSKLSEGQTDFLSSDEGFAIDVSDVWDGQIVAEELLGILQPQLVRLIVCRDLNHQHA